MSDHLLMLSVDPYCLPAHLPPAPRDRTRPNRTQSLDPVIGIMVAGAASSLFWLGLWSAAHTLSA